MHKNQYNFEWDPRKASSTFLKHGVTFEESATIFKDPEMISTYDTQHSEFEDRWISIGLSETGKILIVCHTYKETDDLNSTIRIFSARKATKTESKQYKRWEK